MIRPRVSSRLACIRAGSTSSAAIVASVARRRAAGQHGQIRQGLPLRMPAAERRAHAPGPCRPAWWRPGPANGWRPTGPRRRPPGCACAAWSRSRPCRHRPAPAPRRPRSASAATSRGPSCPSEPVSRPRKVASSATRSRVPCQGRVGQARSSSAAIASATSIPRSPSEASVPAAPPSWTTRRRGFSSARRTWWREMASSQPAALRPSVVGRACWSQVRPIMAVRR